MQEHYLSRREAAELARKPEADAALIGAGWQRIKCAPRPGGRRENETELPPHVSSPA